MELPLVVSAKYRYTQNRCDIILIQKRIYIQQIYLVSMEAHSWRYHPM